MKNSRSTEIKVGVTVVIGIILILWVIGWAKNVDIFSDKKTLQIKFDSVAGLESGDKFSVKGVRKGFVENIEMQDGHVLALVTVDPDTDLKEDASFSIMMLDLMGGKKIEATPGTSDVKIDYDQVQNGYFAGDISTMIATLGSMQTDLIDLVDQVKISLTNVNNLIGDEEFINEVHGSVNNLNELLITLNNVTNENKDNLKTLLVNIDTLVTNTNNFLNENKESVKDITSGIKLSLDKTNKLLDKITLITDETTSGENNLGKLLYDETLVSDLKATIEQTRKMIEILLKQLQTDGINVDANIF